MHVACLDLSWSHKLYQKGEDSLSYATTGELLPRNGAFRQNHLLTSISPTLN